MIPLTIGSLFSGIGGFELGLERTGGFKTVWQCEIDPFCQKILEKHWPDVKRFTDIKKMGIEEGIPHVNVICGGFPCFTAGTLVETSAGYRPIESLRVGCLVKTHNNRFKKVYSVMNREAPVLQVDVRGSLPIKATAEHPFLIRRRVDTRPHRGPITHTFGDPEWVYAKDLDESCYVGMPLDTPGPDLRIWESEAFWYLIGRWLGDGWIVNHKRTSKIPQGHRGSRVNSRVWKVIICTDHEDASNLKAEIEKAGFHATESREETVTKFHISSKELVNFLKPFGKGADGKRIPGFVFKAPLAIQRALFQGWIDSDGYETDKMICGTTVCRELAIGMTRLSRNTYRMPTTVRLAKVPDKTTIEGRTVSQKPFYQVRVWKTSKTLWGWEDDVCWSQVRSVKDLNSIKTVYNISVEEDETYVANECIVHNCQPVSCAGKRKGKEDERWLWPEFYRIVCEVKPQWVLVENVPGLLSADSGRLFAGILRDLSESGYDAEWNIVSAASVGAPHLRKRVFIVAHAEQQSGGRESECCEADGPNTERPAGRVSGSGDGRRALHVADSDQIRRYGRAGVFWQGRRSESEDCCAEFPDTSSEGLPQPEQEWEHGGSAAQCSRRIFERRLGGASDGLFPGLDGPWGEGWEDGVPRVVTGQKDRVNRLKALGNAIVPQCATYIAECVLKYQEALYTNESNI